ncbi:Aste57867_15697 [Aphanomyces stellatus]|uniref:Aste57867_15697 protein n=1 Tax=Aphanomyces stellatus TaxID=120398 RepID=A0A485L5K8_9STRA|nr:hypothetical protein As57867_015641 [Aphanomyces stellatus]VFT92489.1 Aste57867_15697 [Aphanomyces stellatus]
MDQARVLPHTHKSALYTLTIVNKESRASFSTTKTDRDFELLRDHVCSVLDHGHSCDALCPWFFVDVQQKIPKRPLFRKATHPKVVDAHLHAYQQLMDVLVAFIKNPHNRSCHRATDRVPDALFDFLFRRCGNSVTVDPAMFAESKLRHSFNSPSSSCIRRTHSSSSSHSEAGDCSLCCGASDACGWTTLPCGHAFHDDCILDALNASLACPTCAATPV